MAGTTPASGARADVTDGHAFHVRAVVDQHRICTPLGPHGPDLPAQVQPGIDGAGELADRFQSISQVLVTTADIRAELDRESGSTGRDMMAVRKRGQNPYF